MKGLRPRFYFRLFVRWIQFDGDHFSGGHFQRPLGVLFLGQILGVEARSAVAASLGSGQRAIKVKVSVQGHLSQGVVVFDFGALINGGWGTARTCLLYTSPSPRD